MTANDQETSKLGFFGGGVYKIFASVLAVALQVPNVLLGPQTCVFSVLLA